MASLGDGRGSCRTGRCTWWIDSTGVKLFGQGEWQDEKLGRSRRAWRKLHLALDATTGEITASILTGNDADDAGQVPTCSPRSRAQSRASPRMALMTVIPSTKPWRIGNPTRHRTSSFCRAHQLRPARSS